MHGRSPIHHLIDRHFYLCLILILQNYQKSLATRGKINGTLIVQVLKGRIFPSSWQFGTFVNAYSKKKHLQTCQIVYLKEIYGLSVPELWVCHLLYFWLLKACGSSVKLESSINKRKSNNQMLHWKLAVHHLDLSILLS